MLRPTWDPFTDVVALRDQINRLFEENASRTPARERRESLPQRTWAPPVDILEDKDSIILQVDLPGMRQDEIQIELVGDTLNIRGERKLPDQADPKCVRSERLAGPFARMFTLTTPVQPDKVTANYREGVLEVKIPKAEETKPRRVQITAG